jgi:biopolymer transport protein ExbD
MTVCCLLALGACREPRQPDPTPVAQISAEPPPPAEPAQDASATLAGDGAPKVVVTVLQTSIAVDDRPLDDSEIVSVARRLVDEDPEVRLYLRADHATAWGRIIHAIDLLKQGGVARYAFLPPGAKQDAKPLPFELPKVGSWALPPPEASGQGGFPAQPLFLGLEVFADGTLHVDGRRESDDTLVPLLRDVLAKEPDVRVIVRADRAVTYGRVVALYGALLEAGARHIAFGVVISR